MIIGLYANHHHLPFWRPGGHNPVCEFDPIMWRFGRTEEGTLLKDSVFWAFLVALHELDAPGLMANVSMGVSIEGRAWWVPHRAWVQITTLPERKDGVLQVVRSGQLNVIHVWGGDNGTHGPWEWIKGKPKWSEKDWTTFFTEALKEGHMKRLEEIARLSRELFEQETIRNLTARWKGDHH